MTKQFGTKEPRGHLQGVAFSVVCKYTRYADDIAIFCDELAPDAFRILDELNIFLDESLGMELSEEETCHIREGFDFLGFNLQWRVLQN